VVCAKPARSERVRPGGRGSSVRAAALAAATGYLHRLYAEAVSDGATLIELTRSRGWILRRPIPGTSWTDATGPYPLFACRDWSQLGRDIEEIEGDPVSVSVVADPFGEHDMEGLGRAGWTVKPFKEHYVVELDRQPAKLLSRSHRRQVRTALAAVAVELTAPAEWSDDWAKLYALLVRRHCIRGPAAFSELSLRRQLSVPGMVMFRASVDGVTAGINLWSVHSSVAYYHLGASSGEGYRRSASHALMWAAVEHFAGLVDVLNLGGGPGLEQGASGLTEFKRRWATTSRTAYFLSRILDSDRYGMLVRGRGNRTTPYFPAYR